MQNTNKILFIFVNLMAVLFIVVPIKVEAQKKATNKSNRSAPTAQAGKCSVVVRNDLLPNKGVVVVGCDSFGIHEAFINMQGRPELFPSNGGIIVFDADMNLIFKWEACTACGGFFSSFAGTKKIKGHNALLVKLVNGPRNEKGITTQLTLPLYFNGKTFTFAGQ
ncbi:MAG: hypothetical protein WA584_16720 [Pyrinomonadaceae bacterium]